MITFVTFVTSKLLQEPQEQYSEVKISKIEVIWDENVKLFFAHMFVKGKSIPTKSSARPQISLIIHESRMFQRPSGRASAWITFGTLFHVAFNLQTSANVYETMQDKRTVTMEY